MTPTEEAAGPEVEPSPEGEQKAQPAEPEKQPELRCTICGLSACWTK